jgi:hypothetical protein
MENPIEEMPPDVKAEILRKFAVINERFAEMEVGFKEMNEGLDKLAEEIFAKIEPEKRPYYPKGLYKAS